MAEQNDRELINAVIRERDAAVVERDAAERLIGRLVGVLTKNGFHHPVSSPPCCPKCTDVLQDAFALLNRETAPLPVRDPKGVGDG